MKTQQRRIAVPAAGLVIALLLAACGDSSTAPPEDPAVAAHAGNQQNGTVGQPLATAPAVRVTRAGQPEQGTQVTFAVASGGGSVAGATQTTDANGVATVGGWTLGTATGSNTLTATVSDATGSPVTFSATAAADDPAEVEIVGGNNQTALVQSTLPVAPSVRVVDQYGNPIAGVSITFAVATGGGTLTGPAQTTNASGVATLGSWRLGLAAGAQTITATAVGDALENNPATFTANGTELLLNPSIDTVLTAGTLNITRMVIAAGRTVTVAGPLTINAANSIEINGTLTANCVAVTLDAEVTLSVTGTVNNGCAANTAGQALTLVGGGGYNLSGAEIISGGNVTITNDLAISSTILNRFFKLTSARSGSPAADGTGSCTLLNTELRPMPERGRNGADDSPNGQPGSSGFEWSVECAGDLSIAGNVTINAQDGGNGGNGTATQASAVTSVGGAGGHGGITRVISMNGRVIVSGTGNRIEAGSGGNGGSATATAQQDPIPAKGPNATATGGAGGTPGAFDLRGGAGITVQNPFNIQVGVGGRGGDATAVGANGVNSTGVKDAQDGGDATAASGAGGTTPVEVFTPQGLLSSGSSAAGDIIGGELVIMTGGTGGNGGTATATGGDGGDGTVANHPDGGDGGNIRATGGFGGSALVKDLQNTGVGEGGMGGNAVFNNANGGDGWDDCGDPMVKGGDAGKGGDAMGGGGLGGDGSTPGANGTITVNGASNGGAGGDGAPPGAGGAAGADQILAEVAVISSGMPRFGWQAFSPGIVRVDNGLTFEAGDPGNVCAPPNPSGRYGVYAGRVTRSVFPRGCDWLDVHQHARSRGIWGGYVGDRAARRLQVD